MAQVNTDRQLRRDQPDRTVGLLGAMSIGIGGMVGGGIFAVLGLVALLAGGSTPAAFFVAGVIALLTAYSYAKLTVAYPSKGGTVVFIDRAFGVGLLTGSANNLLWISYVVTLALYAVAFANYAASLMGQSEARLIWHLLVSLAILLPTALNLLSAEFVSRTETYVVVVKLAILALVIATGFRNIERANLAPADWPALGQIVAAGMIIFVAYEGFELIANAAEDTKNVPVTLPRAYYGSVLFVILLYCLIAMVTVGSLTPGEIQRSADFALAEAARPSLGQIGFVLVGISAVLATFSAINATLYGAARLSYTIATEGELPALIERKVWKQPIVGLLITTGLALALANLFDLSSISVMGSAGFLIIFAVVNAANFAKAPEIGSSRMIAAAGVIGCSGALAILVRYTLTQKPADILVLLAMLALALVVEWLYQREHGGVKGRVRLTPRNPPEIGGR
jgi:amino acid transporter